MKLNTMLRAIPHRNRVVGIAKDFCVKQGQKRKNSSAISSILDAVSRKKTSDDDVRGLCGVALVESQWLDRAKSPLLGFFIGFFRH